MSLSRSMRRCSGHKHWGESAIHVADLAWNRHTANSSYTCMNEQTKFHPYPVRAKANANASRPKRQRPPSSDTTPARQFLICLGWLRLFQAIAFETRTLPGRGATGET